MLTALSLIAAIIAGAVAAVSLNLARSLTRALRGAQDATRRAQDDRKHAQARARLAEAALADLRIRRSRAVSKGNRTRAEAKAARRRAMTDEIQAATAAKRAPREPELQFPTQPTTGDIHG
jgi:hypothetical protein